MKKILNLVTVIAIIGMATLFSSCNKSSSSSNTINTMTATIGSASWSSSCGFYIDSASAVLTILGSDNIYFTPGYSYYPYITLYIANYTVGQTGIFNITTYSTTSVIIGAEAIIESNSTTGPFTSAVAQTGSIIITSASSSQIVGTFSFTCTDGTTVTNGNFNTKLIL